MTLTLAATAMLAAYALLCAVKPFGKCRRCAGKGHRTTAVRKRPRPCRRCKASGLRRRWGRSLYVWAKKTYKPMVDQKRRARAAA
ncbi:hypothetical protein [Micromonospora sp. DT47]|uniref:hypothetical protein n=1 Tax=Micromonospora sp. DT47 TaxID=3393431 RepID=UPI003CF98E81